jgi:DNA-binding response OmpR family regulator
LNVHVLIADDDRVLTHLLTTRLKAEGYTVSVAYDVMQATASAMRLAPDVVILDIRMPGGSGLDVIKRLRASTKVATLPVLVLSSSPDPKMPATVKSLGADEFLGKPVDLDLLLKALRRLTGQPASPGEAK